MQGPKGDPGSTLFVIADGGTVTIDGGVAVVAAPPAQRLVLRDSAGTMLGWAISERFFWVPAAGCALMLTTSNLQPTTWVWSTDYYQGLHFENSNCTGRTFYGELIAMPECYGTYSPQLTMRYFRWKQPLDWVSFTTHSYIDGTGSCVSENVTSSYGELVEVFPPSPIGALSIAME